MSLQLTSTDTLSIVTLSQKTMNTTNGHNALVIMTEFERKLAACTTLGEAKVLRDEAESLRHYARVAGKGVQAQNRCVFLRQDRFEYTDDRKHRIRQIQEQGQLDGNDRWSSPT